jgi:hypothetical protein
LEIKLKGRYFDTLGVTEAELQAVLDTVTERDFREKNGRSTGNGGYAQKGITLRVMVASRPEIRFDQMAEPVPEIMEV